MTSAPSATFPTPLVSTEWLAEHLKDPDLRVLDCTVVMQQAPGGGYAFASGRDDYVKSHIPGAVFCDVTDDLRDRSDPRPQMMPSAQQISEVMAGLGVGAETRVVLYDRGNHSWAARAWWSLKTFDFDDAAVLDGGWQKWRAEGRPVSSEPGTYPRGKFAARYRPELLASKADVMAALGDRDTLIINALSPAAHSGQAKQFARAGRIKGSANVHADSLLDAASKAYLSRAELGEHFGDVGAKKARRIITYCGGGVSACSDALALTLLGFDNVRVYDGSLAEWTADPNAPMETG
jgi:thiosulfate/3-mercaptopyruvate sulfurtransferase